MPAEVAEAPVVETTSDPLSTPVGDVYEKAKAKAEQGELPTESKPEVKEKPAEAKPDKAEAKKGEPASAVDAVLEGAKPEEKPAETPSADPLEGLDEKKANWPKAREVISRQGKELTNLHAEVAAFKKQNESAKVDIEAAKKLAAVSEENTKLRDAITALNVEYEPEFRAKYIDGRQKLIDKTIARVKDFGGDADTFKNALALTGKARTELLKAALVDVDEIDRPRLIAMVDQVQQLDDEKAEKQGDPQKAFEEFQRGRAERQTKESEKAEAYKKSVVEKVGKELRNKMYLLNPVDPSLKDAEQWNGWKKRIDEGVHRALRDDATPEETTERAYWSEAGPIYQELWEKEVRAGKTKDANLKEYEGAEPGFKGGKSPVKSGRDAKIETDPGKLYEQSMAGGGDD